MKNHIQKENIEITGKLSYRNEIDGLRAIAVIAVIIFHLNANWLRGGFLGVDIFLVLSGFLITSIIYPKVLDGSFSIYDFWKRRFRRLFPALSAMVVVVLWVGAVILAMPERGELPLEALGALLSFENIHLWRSTGGYWSTASENISLLHTWSLSLEEHFYIFFPLFLIAARKFSVVKRYVLLLAISLISFVLYLSAGKFDPNASFYLLPMRMWEFLVGCFLAMKYFHGKIKGPVRYAWLLQIIGIIIILTSILYVENSEKSASFIPVVTCLGTLLILMYGSAPGPVRALLGCRPVAFVGKLSYSLYLWHWPVIVFAKYISPSFSPAIMVCMTLALACLSYYFIELPFRYRRKIPLIPTLCVVVISFLPILLLTTSPFLREFGNMESKKTFDKGSQYEATKELRRGHAGLLVTGSSLRPDLCLTGSSHARMLCSPIDEYAESNEYSLRCMATSGVGLTTKPRPSREYADMVNSERLKHIHLLKPRVLIVAGMWSTESRNHDFSETLSASILEMSNSVEHMIVLGEIPLIELPPLYDDALRKYLVQKTLSRKPSPLTASGKSIIVNRQVEEIINGLSLDNVVFVNPYELLSNMEGDVLVVQDGEFLYSNCTHVNRFGASLIFDNLLFPLIDEYLD